jgi:hypothetical protein
MLKLGDGQRTAPSLAHRRHPAFRFSPFHFLERQRFHLTRISREHGCEARFGENDGENEMERRSVLLDGAAGGTDA